MSQHFLSVAAVFKNESHIIKEWIDHYLKEGVDHFYLINNNSTDNFMEALRPYANVITLGHETKDRSQVKSYNGYVLPVKNDTKWMLVCDLDEFAYAKNQTLSEFIKRRVPNCINGIRLPWLQFGSSGHIRQPNSVIDGFRKRKEHKLGERVSIKMIVKTKDIHYFGIHEQAINGWNICDGCMMNVKNESLGYIDENYIKSSGILINHYPVQSREWFTNIKMVRGRSHSAGCCDENYFKNLDFNDVIDDTLALKRGFQESHQDISIGRI